MGWLPLFIEAERQRRERNDKEDTEMEERRRRLEEPYSVTIRERRSDGSLSDPWTISDRRDYELSSREKTDILDLIVIIVFLGFIATVITGTIMLVLEIRS